MRRRGLGAAGRVGEPARRSPHRRVSPERRATRGQPGTAPQARPGQAPARRARPQAPPANQAPVKQAPRKQAPVKQAPRKQAPVEQAPRAQSSSGGAGRAVRQVRTGSGRAVRTFAVRGPVRPPRPGDPRRRLRVALIVLLFVLTLFAGRLVQMQGLDGPTVARVALDKRTTTVSLPAHRGDITDAGGAVLATTVERRDILVDQTLVARYKRVENGASTPPASRVRPRISRRCSACRRRRW